MNRTEALAIVQEICFGPAENIIITPLLERLQNAYPRADISDLIFHHPVELTPEQVVDIAMQREADYDRKANQN